ncbi:MAG: hypothetical protein KBT27_13120 [Prevotellaceae bacterium]|nr:hypothetical protein [Candidatus Faecinaster equi]
MTISKDGKNYSIPSSCKTTEDDFITISMGYKAKEIFDKSEIATLIVVLTNILYGKNKYEQIRAEVIEEVKGLAQHYLIGAMDLENATKYGNKNAKQQDISYGSLMRYEIADCVDDFMDSVERLKEQKC